MVWLDSVLQMIPLTVESIFRYFCTDGQVQGMSQEQMRSYFWSVQHRNALLHEASLNTLL